VLLDAAVAPDTLALDRLSNSRREIGDQGMWWRSASASPISRSSTGG
jgi:hypothetical protein